MNLTYVDPASLQPRERKLRKRHPRQIDFLKRSIEAHGFVEPVLTRNSRVVHGELRVVAAVQLSLPSIPAIEVAHLSDAQLRALVIATNRIAALADFDEEALSVELGELSGLEVDLGSLGFEAADLDRLLGLTEPEAAARIEEVPALGEGTPVAKVGDLWLLGRHRLFCGSALEEGSYRALLGDERAKMILSDPPYNDRVSSISGGGKIKHPEFVQASGELSEDQYTRFMTTACRHMRAFSTAGSLHYLFMSWRHLLALLRAGNIVYDELKAVVTWMKPLGGMGSLYRSQTEFVCVFKAGQAAHINNILLGKFGRNRTNLWQYDGLAGFRAGRDELLAMHPTVKPVQLIADAILDASELDGIVLDPFAGSGTIFLAAEQTRRRAAAMELDPRYVDVCLRRYRNAVGVEPIHATTGRLLRDCEEEPQADVLVAGERA